MIVIGVTVSIRLEINAKVCISLGFSIRVYTRVRATVTVAR